MRTLYISDLDGTLLTDEATLSEFGRTTLHGLLQDGLPFSVASARSVVGIRMILEGLRLTLPVVEFNGAFITDLKTGRHEVINALESEILEDIYALITRFGFVPFISTFNGTEDCLYYREAINDGMRWYLEERVANKDPRLRATGNLTDAFRDQVVCITTIGKAEVLPELEDAIREQHGDLVEIHFFENRYSPGWYWLTVHDRRATKDQAIQTLMQMYGLSEAELVVFGDHANDIKVFKTATQSVAVANAIGELKRHATHVIGSNQEDSVVRYIHDHWHRNKPNNL